MEREIFVKRKMAENDFLFWGLSPYPVSALAGMSCIFVQERGIAGSFLCKLFVLQLTLFLIFHL